MKKVLALLAFVLLGFTIIACDATDNGDNGNGNGTDAAAPVLTGMTDVDLEVGDSFNPREGVTATDELDGVITASIVLNIPAGLTLVGGNVVFEEEGTFVFEYSVTNTANKTTEGTRTVTVTLPPGPDPTENMVENGDFSQGTNGWILDLYEGAGGNMSVVGGELQIILSGDPYGTAPRVSNAGMMFIQGRTYEVSFDARANTPRRMATQVGHIINPPVEPWFIDFNPAEYRIVDLTTTMQTFTYTFTMNQPSQDGSITFELGTFIPAGGTEADRIPFVATTVYIDNIVVREIN